MYIVHTPSSLPLVLRLCCPKTEVPSMIRQQCYFSKNPLLLPNTKDNLVPTELRHLQQQNGCTNDIDIINLFPSWVYVYCFTRHSYSSPAWCDIYVFVILNRIGDYIQTWHQTSRWIFMPTGTQCTEPVKWTCIKFEFNWTLHKAISI